MEIRRITSEATLPIRKAVLWPDYPIEASQVDGDDAAQHFGGLKEDHLICVASLFPSETEIRLRKFATLRDHQGKGAGSAMMSHLLSHARQQGFARFWFDARESAIPFYSRFGFETESARFFKRDIPYRRMFLDLN